MRDFLISNFIALAIGVVNVVIITFSFYWIGGFELGLILGKEHQLHEVLIFNLLVIFISSFISLMAFKLVAKTFSLQQVLLLQLPLAIAMFNLNGAPLDYSSTYNIVLSLTTAVGICSIIILYGLTYKFHQVKMT